MESKSNHGSASLFITVSRRDCSFLLFIFATVICFLPHCLWVTEMLWAHLEHPSSLTTYGQLLQSLPLEAHLQLLAVKKKVLDVGLGCTRPQEVSCDLGPYMCWVNAGFSPSHWSIAQMAWDEGISKPDVPSEASMEDPRSGNLCEIWRRPRGLVAGPLWGGAIFSTLLVPPRQRRWAQGPSSADVPTPNLSQLCVVDGCATQLQRSVAAWFPALCDEYLATLLFLLSCC